MASEMQNLRKNLMNGKKNEDLQFQIHNWKEEIKEEQKHQKNQTYTRNDQWNFAIGFHKVPRPTEKLVLCSSDI